MIRIIHLSAVHWNAMEWGMIKIALICRDKHVDYVVVIHTLLYTFLFYMVRNKINVFAVIQGGLK